MFFFLKEILSERNFLDFKSLVIEMFVICIEKEFSLFNVG